VRAALAVAATLGVGVGLAACSNSGTALAQQACGHVTRSITLLHESDVPAAASRQAALRQQAYVQLRDALPIAAQAAWADGQWQALMTTVSESNRVPEATLVTALSAQCASATTQSPFDQAPPSSSIPPPAPVGSS
jgi:hypothetical protein